MGGRGARGLAYGAAAWQKDVTWFWTVARLGRLGQLL